MAGSKKLLERIALGEVSQTPENKPTRRLIRVEENATDPQQLEEPRKQAHTTQKISPKDQLNRQYEEPLRLSREQINWN